QRGNSERLQSPRCERPSIGNCPGFCSPAAASFPAQNNQSACEISGTLQVELSAGGLCRNQGYSPWLGSCGGALSRRSALEFSRGVIPTAKKSRSSRHQSSDPSACPGRL